MDRETIITELEAERNRLTNAISALNGVMTRRKPGMHRLTAKARKLISRRMKASWKERKAKAKA